MKEKGEEDVDGNKKIMDFYLVFSSNIRWGTENARGAVAGPTDCQGVTIAGSSHPFGQSWEVIHNAASS